MPCKPSTVGWGEARTPTGFDKYVGWYKKPLGFIKNSPQPTLVQVNERIAKDRVKLEYPSNH